MIEDQSNTLSHIVIKLLKGVMYQEDDPVRWNSLLNLQSRVRDSIQVLALELIIDEAEGYAYLRSRITDDEESLIPRLITRRPLTFQVSLILVLLRKRLVDFDMTGGDSRLFLSMDDIMEMVRVFLPDSTNEAKIFDQLESNLNRIVELGFLKRIESQSRTMFEVRRIIKAYIDAQWLSEFDQRLLEYRNQLTQNRGYDD